VASCLNNDITGLLFWVFHRISFWCGAVQPTSYNFKYFQPAVYVAESAISSGTAGTSEGSEGTVALVAGLGLASVAVASFILLLVGKNPSNITTAEYKGPSLSYYINKFKPAEIIQAAVPSQTESPSSIQADSSMPEVPEIQVQSAPEVSEVPVQSQYEPEPLTSSVSSANLAN